MCHFFQGLYVQRFVTKSDFQKLCEYLWEVCTLRLPNMLTVHPMSRKNTLSPPPNVLVKQNDKVTFTPQSNTNNTTIQTKSICESTVLFWVKR